ncbi:MAG: hypothetical protein Q4A28_08805 [Brachymonas sp.]|nr:hypothetical protein [Brachymonas sp.]
MNALWSRTLARLPDWAQELMHALLPALQVLLILAAAVLLQKLLRRLVRRVAARHDGRMGALGLNGVCRRSVRHAWGLGIYH